MKVPGHHLNGVGVELLSAAGDTLLVRKFEDSGFLSSRFGCHRHLLRLKVAGG
jgi:hypothetical protein